MLPFRPHCLVYLYVRYFFLCDHTFVPICIYIMHSLACGDTQSFSRISLLQNDPQPIDCTRDQLDALMAPVSSYLSLKLNVFVSKAGSFLTGKCWTLSKHRNITKTYMSNSTVRYYFVIISQIFIFVQITFLTLSTSDIQQLGFLHSCLPLSNLGTLYFFLYHLLQFFSSAGTVSRWLFCCCRLFWERCFQ